MAISVVDMEIKINNITYSSLVTMRGMVADDVVDFLQEWFDDEDYISGHTSGSTGAPRAIRLLKDDMRASARLTNAYLGINSDSVLLLCLSPAYIAGKMMIVRALEAGASLVVTSPSATPLQELTQPITLVAMVPMQVVETLRRNDGAERISQIASLLVGGAPVSEELEQQLMMLPTTTYVTYGMTETVSHVALRRVGEECYTALGDVTFEVDDRGCLVIEAPQLSGRRFVTNDIVMLHNSRRFIWQGRYDNVIMSGGLKFCAEVLEGKISTIISRRYYITSAPDERLGQRVVLVIEGTPYDDTMLEQLKIALQDCLSRYEMPREIRFLPHFKETFSGKVKRE